MYHIIYDHRYFNNVFVYVPIIFLWLLYKNYTFRFSSCLDLLFRYTHVPISCFIMQLLIFGSMCSCAVISTFANPWAAAGQNISGIFIWIVNEAQELKKLSQIFPPFYSSHNEILISPINKLSYYRYILRERRLGYQISDHGWT